MRREKNVNDIPNNALIPWIIVLIGVILIALAIEYMNAKCTISTKHLLEHHEARVIAKGIVQDVILPEGDYSVMECR